MLKKIVFICLFVLNIGVEAKEIIIDDIAYDNSQSIVGEGYRFDHVHNVLYLDNYDGGSISFDGNLTIALYNKNVITCDVYDYGIKGVEVLLREKGSLLIDNSNIGIISNSLKLYNISLLVRSLNIGIKVTGKNIDLNYANLVIESNGTGIFVNKVINSHYSKINILRGRIGISSMDKFGFFVYGSTLYFKNDHVLMNCSLFDVEESLVFTKGAINDLNFIFHETNNLFGSNDGEEFFKVNNYFDSQYLVITNKENFDVTNEELVIAVDDFVITKDVLTENEYYTEGISLPDNPNTYDSVLSWFLIFIFSIVIFIMLRRIYVRAN